MSEVWGHWEGQVINGEFPLRRCLGVSDHSGVFLTEAPLLNLPQAALKLVPLIPTLAESQLAHWNAAAALSHPHLIRLFATGRCQLGALQCLYVLMEYAEQNLAHLLRNRPLSDTEARDLLPPALDALAFLHSHNQVQGQLRPSNILVVGDELKLASDTIRPAGEAATSISMLSVYDPPEGRDGSFSTAGDIWALGVTLYEALTQTTPEKPSDRSHGVVLPADFPAGSADVIRECLSRRPGDRPSVSQLQAWLRVRPRQEAMPAAAESGGGAADDGTAVVGVSGDVGADAAALAPSRMSAAAASSQAVAVQGAPAQATSTQAGSPQGASAQVASPRAASEQGMSARAASPQAASVQGASTQGASPQTASAQAASARVASTPPRAFPQPTAAPSGAETDASGRLTIRAVVERDSPQPRPLEKRSLVTLALGVAAIIVVAWFGVRHLSGSANSKPSPDNTPVTAPAAADTATASAGATSSSPSTAPSQNMQSSAAPASPHPANPPSSADAASSARHKSTQRGGRASNNTRAAASEEGSPASVVHEEMPNVPRSALSTIHGRVKVIVRVTVNQSGSVVSDTLEHSGPSRYFARAASEAARKWKFAPAPGNASRTWLVRFEFSRSGATGRLVIRS